MVIIKIIIHPNKFFKRNLTNIYISHTSRNKMEKKIKDCFLRFCYCGAINIYNKKLVQ
jgi:predicted transcriptional regulator of viral defense system